MADSAVAITAGTGTNVDTRTEATNGDHRQVIVVGDPSTTAGVAPVSATQGLGVNVASGGIASGAVASGAVASGAFASGSIASGAIASGAIAAGAIAAGATSIADNEDAASADGDRGVKILAIQRATPADTAGTDLDYSMLQMSTGRLWTSAQLPSGSVASGAIASGAVASGAFASGSIASGAVASGAIAAGAIAAGATSIADNEDAASNDGDRGVKMLAVQKATPANTAGTDGDYEFLQVSGGKLWTAPLGFFVTCSTDITRPNDTTAYASGDNWSDSTSAPTSGGYTFTSAGRKSGGSGIILDLWVSSSNSAGAMQGEVWIFDTSVTNINDNAAFAISDSEIKTVVAKVPFTTVADTNNAGVHVQNLQIGYTCVGSANLRYLVKLKASYTPAAQEVLTVRIKCLQID